jgi:hypothetical protein
MLREVQKDSETFTFQVGSRMFQRSTSEDSAATLRTGAAAALARRRASLQVERPSRPSRLRPSRVRVSVPPAAAAHQHHLKCWDPVTLRMEVPPAQPLTQDKLVSVLAGHRDGPRFRARAGPRGPVPGHGLQGTDSDLGSRAALPRLSASDGQQDSRGAASAGAPGSDVRVGDTVGQSARPGPGWEGDGGLRRRGLQ